MTNQKWEMENQKADKFLPGCLEEKIRKAEEDLLANLSRELTTYRTSLFDRVAVF